MSALWPTGSKSQPRITDGFGPRPNGPVGALPFHYGADIPMRLGADIAAAQGGVVVFSGWNGTLGVQVVVRSESGHEFLYPHQEEGKQLPYGRWVIQGQSVGKVGLTGLTTGPHTCFRVFEGSWRSNVNARNPVAIMAQLNAGTSGLTPIPIEEIDAMSAVHIKSGIGETLTIDGVFANGNNDPLAFAQVTGATVVTMPAEMHRSYIINASKREGLPVICYVDGEETVYLLEGGKLRAMQAQATLRQMHEQGASSITITPGERDAWLQ